MRGLCRNETTVYFKNFIELIAITDSDGNDTGEYRKRYSSLSSANMTVSMNKGTSEGELFGTLTDYDRILTCCDTSLGITENSVLWLDGVATTDSPNFSVKKVAKTLDSVAYAVKQMEVVEDTDPDPDTPDPNDPEFSE